ncbi:MAG: hypothetical protein IKS77_03520 [Spirochaetales bacterium]|nr:hypothetical protein [Spirochaetales bacterium]
MRKILLILLISTVLAFTFAAVPQKIYPVDSPEYQAIRDLYLATGHAMPSSSGPWSAAELSSMLDRISTSEIPAFLVESYNAVKTELSKGLSENPDLMSLKLSASTNLELYAHTNTDGQTRTDINDVTEKSFTGRENWSYDLVHTKPILELDLEFDVKDHFYFFLAAEARGCTHGGIGYEREIGNSSFGTNIPGLQNIPLNGDFALNMDANWPYRAFASFGSSAWNVQIGRDRLSWGLGKTGNLGISDNMPYHDMVRFAAFSEKFKYTFLISSFPHKINFYGPYKGSDNKGEPNTDSIQGIYLYLAHRFEGRVLKDKLAFSVTEAIMYASEDATIDPRIFNPAIVFHNFYNASNANSTMVFELDWSPMKSLNVYGQFHMDDFAIPGGENGGSPTNHGFPNALGYLAGARYAMPAWGGLLQFNLEGAYINPYTYLRYNKAPGTASTDTYGLDYIVANRTYITGTGSGDCLVYDEYFLGYQYGNDSAVANLNVEWKLPGKLTVSANAFFMAHGTHDKWTQWGEIGGSGQEQWNQASVAPTTTHETNNYRYDDTELSKRNAVCYTLDIGAYCQYNLSENLKVYGQADFIQIWNSMNRSGVNENDTQFVAGLKYSL